MSTPVLTLAQICKDNTTQQNNPEGSRASSFVPEELFFSSTSHAQTTLHAVLRYLVTTLSQTQPLNEILRTLAALIAEALDVDLCVILLKEQSNDVFNVAACQSDLQSQNVLVQPLQLSAILAEKLTQALQRGELPQLSEHENAALNPLKNVRYKTLQPVPLIVGATCLGLLNCYSSGPRLYSENEQLMLYTIAGQTALMLKNRQCVEEDVQTQRAQVKAFFADLLSGQPGMEDSLHRRACSLHVDLTRTQLLVQLECTDPRTDHEGVLRQLSQRIQHRYPASLVDERTTSLCGLICLDEQNTLAQVQTWFTELVEQVRREQQLSLSVGLSNVCNNLLDYRKADREASEALQVGVSLAAQGSCLAFQDLGAYRYLYQFARSDMLYDHYQEQIEAVVAYDQRKKSNLLDTLESYLESGGNAAKTSTLLDVHRNTLLQRLERVQKLCALDLEQVSNRLPLLLALKVYRLRAHFAHIDAAVH
ncbi:MAG TPA: helix-turn-helix domain-containing protein [Ktedonobacteraceae bacterium]|nr:helix-turn-helix domain-containing protein [Ktedonobacteraceae bacterium]